MLLMILTIPLILLGFFYKNNKVLFALQANMIFILWAFPINRVDLNWYQFDFNNANRNYNIIECFTNERLHFMIMKLFKMVGMNFHFFLIVNSLFCILLILSSIDFFVKKNKCMILSLMLIYPIIEFSIEIQGRTAFCILLFAFRYLKETDVKNIIKYLALVILAAGFHTVAYEALIFAIIFFIRDARLLFAIVLVCFFIELNLFKYIYDIIKYYGLVNESRAVYFLSGGDVSIRNVVRYVIIQLVFIIISVSYGAITRRKEKIQSNNDKTETENNVLVCLIVAVLFMLPFCKISRILYRLPRYSTIIVYMALANRLECDKKQVTRVARESAIVFASIVTLWTLNTPNFELFNLWYIHYVFEAVSLGNDITTVVIDLLVIISVFMIIYYRNSRIENKKLIVVVK